MPAVKEEKLFILGSTGSIGVNTLNIAEKLNKISKTKYKIAGLAAGRNVDLLEKQIRKYDPEVIYIKKYENKKYLKSIFPDKKIYSEDGLCDALAFAQYDKAVNALVGSAGLRPTMTVLSLKKNLLLANKESLVMAGKLVMERARLNGIRVVPIDSEHSALWELLKGKDLSVVHSVILTASGGPFFLKPSETPSVEESLSHPTWNMGPKISIDSATMMNKGLEVIEAHHLFGVSYDRINVIVHPQSLIHALIETIDGEMYAQIGSHDMRHPIQNALTWPELEVTPLKRFSLADAGQMTFFPPDFKKFPLLKLAYESGKAGGVFPAVMNAANEAAVNLFLKKKIAFHDIAKIVHKSLDKMVHYEPTCIDDVITTDMNVKRKIFKDNGAADLML